MSCYSLSKGLWPPTPPPPVLLPPLCSPLGSLHTVRLDVLLRCVVQEGWGWAGGRGEAGVNGGWGCGGGSRTSGGGGAGGVTIAQEASWRGGVWVLLLKGSLGILGVSGTVVQVRAGADRCGNLAGQHQAGLHKCLRVHVWLGQPAHRHKEQKREGGLGQKSCSTRAEKTQCLDFVVYIAPVLGI